MGVQEEVGTGLVLGAAVGEEAAEAGEEAEVVVAEQVAGNPQNLHLETGVLAAGSGIDPSGLA